jgi:hypothetical protein
LESFITCDHSGVTSVDEALEKIYASIKMMIKLINNLEGVQKELKEEQRARIKAEMLNKQ